MFSFFFFLLKRSKDVIVSISYGLTERTDTEPLGYCVLLLFFEDLVLITWTHLSTANTQMYTTFRLASVYTTSCEYAMDEKT